MFPVDTRILIVDDMSSIRDLVKTHLKSLGYTLMVESMDGAAGYEQLLKNLNAGTPIGLVISDWNMPKLSGLDFLKKVRASQEFAQLPFVLLTSETERDQVTDAIMAGVNQYIVKPFSPKTFTEKLQSVFNKLPKK